MKRVCVCVLACVHVRAGGGGTILGSDKFRKHQFENENECLTYFNNIMSLIW